MEAYILCCWTSTTAYSQAKAGNILLNTLSPDDYELLEPHFLRIDLPVRFQLHAAKRKIDSVYLPEDGQVRASPSPSSTSIAVTEPRSVLPAFGTDARPKAPAWLRALRW